MHFTQVSSEPTPLAGENRKRFTSTWLTIALISAMITTVVAGFVYTTHLQKQLGDLRETTRLMRMARQAMMEANTFIVDEMIAVRADRSGLKLYFDALTRLNSHDGADFPATVVVDAQAFAGKAVIDQLKTDWTDILAQIDLGEFDQARQLYQTREVELKIEAVASTYFADLDKIETSYSALQRKFDFATTTVLILQISTGIISILAFLFAARAGARESIARAGAMASANRTREQVTKLFEMTDMLQSANDHTDANAVLKSTAADLIPKFGGALYVFNNSRDRLILSTTWGMKKHGELAESIALQQCWALKRGKPHVNTPEADRLCCEHHTSKDFVLEIPMIARGEILGLLQIHTDGADARHRLDQVAGLSTALADAMSLALANLALRDKLRSQALRDPLTGLYNRRYMEDTLQRVVRLAEREKHEVSVIMIDLDHFKRLNDQYGHAKGDSVLRDTSQAILGQLRETDVACRYGGEELIIVLPNCGIEMAATKAERIRVSIEALSEPNGAKVSASLGVAAMPRTSSSTKELLASADAALYIAKQEGRNRVVRAAPIEGVKKQPVEPEEAPAKKLELVATKKASSTASVA